jgi:hypothetical protein
VRDGGRRASEERGAATARVAGSLAAALSLLPVACAEKGDKPRAGAPAQAAPVVSVADASPPLPPGIDEHEEAGMKSGLARGFVHRDVNHVLSTGQSLSVGAVGYPALSRAQPYHNLMFSTGVIAGASDLTAFVPLVEGSVPRSTHPNDETMSSSLANHVARTYLEEFAPTAKHRSHDVLVSVHGLGGTPYSGLKKGTGAYAAGMAQVKAALEIARSAGKSYVVRVVTNVHGESDHQTANAHYAADLAEWQADYEAGVKALTHQAEPVPMFHTQMSSWPRYGAPTSVIPAAQLAATIASHGKIVLVGPKYHLAYVPDGIHLSNEGYRHMGEDYAKVYRRVVLEGQAWDPVRPVAIQRSGAVITVRFAVPVPPLVLDTHLVTNPGHHGFEVWQSGSTNEVAIKSVALAAPDTVTVTLTAEPLGGVLRLRYAYTAPVSSPAGPRTGPRGNLRDSDATPSRYGYPLHNWCVHFDEPVP